MSKSVLCNTQSDRPVRAAGFKQVDDSIVNMADEGIDIAVRAGVLPVDTLIKRNLGGHGRALSAAPGYRKKHGTPRKPEDLLLHSRITNTAVAAHHHWLFLVMGQTMVQNGGGQVRD